MENILILNGKRYRITPFEAEWQISLIIQNGCPCGHNGQSLPKDAKILEVRLGDETFKVGEIIQEGKILEFLYNPVAQYVRARVEGSRNLVDVDDFKKYVKPQLLSDHVHQFPTDGSPCVLCGRTIPSLFDEPEERTKDELS